MTQEMVRFDDSYLEMQEALRVWLAARHKDLLETLEPYLSKDDNGYPVSAAHAMVAVRTLDTLGKLYRVYDNPDRDTMVPEEKVQARIREAVEEALRVEVPAAVAQARMLWEQEKQILEEGMRQRALDRVRTQG